MRVSAKTLKEGNMKTPMCTPLPEHHIPLVLGAGGWNIFHHIGVLKAVEDLRIDIGTVLGVSCGSLIGAFITNGYNADNLIPIFLKILGARFDPANFVKGIRAADPLSLFIGGWFSLEPAIKEIVDRYGLKPNRRLRILACDILTHQPVIFEGTDYDLVHALTASGSVPSIFQPVWDFSHGQGKLLVDGAVYHFNPTEFTDGPAIVSTFLPETEPPNEGLPIDYWSWWCFKTRELFFPVVGNRRYVDPRRHLVIETGLPQAISLNFGISEKTCMKMVANGYATAKKAFTRAIGDGLLPVPKASKRLGHNINRNRKDRPRQKRTRSVA
jgi:hypothetical protein